ncbi:hypothetical protein [uncultured Microbacterium sp.]|uniref:hypothetical protein n=1 Tax=uncultured Microbacterium sp. TaxID=191216 RepID=UPI0028DC3108|nr:hypothetical protein [uncultured Microbacterium sp.]
MSWTAEPSRTAPVRAAIRPSIADRAETAAPIDLTPVSARAAVGRYTGLSRSRPAAPAPLWRSAGIVGLIALVAAAATPIITEILTVSG